MKFILTIAFFLPFLALQAPVVLASDWKEDQAQADQYYEAGEFSSAFKVYFKLAKIGDSHSQFSVAKMYANGEGKKVDLPEAYAWSVLAAERGATEKVEFRDSLLAQNSDKAVAEKKAEKLKSKYGRDALKKKAESRARLKENTKSGGCTGSKLDCR